MGEWPLQGVGSPPILGSPVEGGVFLILYLFAVSTYEKVFPLWCVFPTCDLLLIFYFNLTWLNIFSQEFGHQKKHLLCFTNINSQRKSYDFKSELRSLQQLPCHNIIYHIISYILSYIILYIISFIIAYIILFIIHITNHITFIVYHIIHHII